MTLHTECQPKLVKPIELRCIASLIPHCGILIYAMIATVTLNPALDKSIYVDRLHPNDTNRILRVEVDAGGKGINASRVLKELGSETIALGFVGGKIGSFIEHVLENEGIPTDFVQVKADTRTNVCIQELTGSPPTMLNEPGPNIAEDDFDKLFDKVRKVARESSFVIFGGSLPPGVPKDIYKLLVNAAQESDSKAILDSDGEPMRLGMKSMPYMIKPNREEAERLVSLRVKNVGEAVRAANILARNGVKLVVISMGADGAVACSAGEVWQAVPPKVTPVSTIGSGDSMVAGIAHILSKGGSLGEALKLGAAAGAATAMTDGTEICSHHQVQDLLKKVRLERLS